MRLFVVLMMAVASAGCILATPGVTYYVESQCQPAFELLVRDWDENTSVVPSASATRIELRGRPDFEQAGDESTIGDIENRDVTEVRMKLIVDAGGSHSLEFGVILPVKKVGEYEYEFPEGPIVISGDQCPPAP